MKKKYYIFLSFILYNYSINTDNKSENDSSLLSTEAGLKVPHKYYERSMLSMYLSNDFLMQIVLNKLAVLCPNAVDFLKEGAKKDIHNKYNFWDIAKDEFKKKLHQDYISLRYEEQKHECKMYINFLNSYMHCIACIEEGLEAFDRSDRKG